MKKSPPTQLPAILERATLALRRSQRPPKRDAPRALKGIPRSFTTEDQRCFSPESRHPGRPSARLLVPSDDIRVSRQSGSGSSLRDPE